MRLLFARRPESTNGVLGIVYRCIAGHLLKQAGLSPSTALTGAVTLIQRLGCALKLNVHFRRLFMEEMCVERREGSLRFRWLNAPTSAESARLT